MSDQDDGGPSPKPTVPAALQQWREAERAVTVSQKGQAGGRGRVPRGCGGTDAAQAALMAQESAGKTAKAAKLIATTTVADAGDADTEPALADAGAELAKHWYGEAQRDLAAKAADGSGT